MSHRASAECSTDNKPKWKKVLNKAKNFGWGGQKKPGSSSKAQSDPPKAPEGTHGISEYRAIEDAAEDVPENYPDIDIYLEDLFEYVPHLDGGQAIYTLEDALLCIPRAYPNRPFVLDRLGVAFRTRFEKFGDLRDIEEAVAKQEEAVRLCPRKHPNRARYLSNLALSLHTRFESFDDIADVDLAIATQEEGLLLVPRSNPDRLIHLSDLAMYFNTRFYRLGILRDIEQAIARSKEAVQLTSRNDPKYPLRLHNLAVYFRTRFERCGDVRDIEEAIERHEEAVTLSRDQDDHPMYLNNLATSIMTRFERFGDARDIERAIARQEEAVQLTPRVGPERAKYLNALAASFGTRYARFGDLRDLEQAIARQEEAVQLTRSDHPECGRYLSNLGISYGTRFEHLGNLDDLERAIVTQEEALEALSPAHSSRANCLVYLGDSLRTRFYRLGDLRDLDQAIARQEEAIKLTPRDHPNLALYLQNLGTSYATRFNRLGDVHDIEQAIARKEEALQLIPRDHPDRVVHLINLGISLLDRCGRLGDLRDLEEAIARQEEAVQLVPHDHLQRGRCLFILGTSFLSQFNRLGNLRDLEQGIKKQVEGVQLVPRDHPKSADLLNILGASFRVRFNRLGDLRDIEQAIQSQEESVRLSPHDHPSHAGHLLNLGISFRAHFERLGDRSNLLTALSNFSSAARKSAAPSFIRFSASLHWIWCAQTLEHDSLLDAYSVAIQILPQLAWIGLPLHNRYHELMQASSVVREAASTALQLGRPEQAVEWLEQGRSVVWNDLLQLRTPLDELRAEYPMLADELSHVSNALEHASARDQSMGVGMGMGYRDTRAMTSVARAQPSLEDQAREHRSLALKREALLAEVRSLPGFERFMMGKTIAQLMMPARFGPVVILNASEKSCDAMIILADSDQIQRVPFPDFTFADAQSLQAALERLLRDCGRNFIESDGPGVGVDVDDTSLHQAESVLLKRFSQDLSLADRGAKLARPLGPTEYFKLILSILWMRIVKPVLDTLGLSTPGELRRVFWCPTGPLAFLPIHAAGLYDTTEPGSKLSDFAISSYTPTLSALSQSPESNAIGNPTPPVRLLTVRQPDSDGQMPLPGTREEIQCIKTTLEAASESSARITLVESDGTVEDVLDMMKETDWVHFACHGVQDLERPIDSALLLADRRRLKLSDIIQLSRPRGGLAFLSACQTATGDKRLSEEAVHLASGMLLAGYSSVIATMWQIGDRDAPEVAQDVYERLFREGEVPKSRGSAVALHEAVQNLRGRGASFFSWVPFIHIGV